MKCKNRLPALLLLLLACGNDDSGLTTDASTSDAQGSLLDAVPAPDGKVSIPCASVGGKPGAPNTGPDETELMIMDGLFEITTPGMYENIEVHGGIQIKADNVTLRNFRVVGGLYGIQLTYGATNVLLEQGEILDANSAGVYGGGFTARCLDIHDIGGDAFKTTDDTHVEYSWMHHIGTNDKAHADGNQTRGGSNHVFRYNFCDMGVTIPAPYKSNACFILQETNGVTVDNFVIEDNWLEGGNYTIYCNGGGTTYVRRNRFGRDYRYGIVTGACTEWTDNVWEDDGTPAP